MYVGLKPVRSAWPQERAKQQSDKWIGRFSVPEHVSPFHHPGIVVVHGHFRPILAAQIGGIPAGRDRIVYAGMPSESVYSIVQMKWEFLYRGYAWNLYFPVGQNRIRIDGVNILVESATRDEIRLRL